MFDATNAAPAFSWPTAVPFWALLAWVAYSEISLVRRTTDKRPPSAADKGSLLLIICSIGAALAFAVACGWLGTGRLPHRLEVPAYSAGLAMILAGALLRRHCWAQLGQDFTSEVRAVPGQCIVESGAYAWVRHPSYAGGMAMNIGAGLALTTWPGLVALAVAGVAAYSYRMHVEEKALCESLGEPYVRYMASRKRIIPFVY